METVDDDRSVSSVATPDLQPSGRIFLKTIILTPEAVVSKKIDEGMKLIEMSYGSAKELHDNNFNSGDWEQTKLGLEFIATEGCMFLAKTEFGERGACEVTVKTIRWLVKKGYSAFDNNHIDTLIMGCKALATLADTEIANKIRLGRCGAIDVANDILDLYTGGSDIDIDNVNDHINGKSNIFLDNHELLVNTLQILLNLPNRVVSSSWNFDKNPYIREFGHVDNVSIMHLNGTSDIVLDIFVQTIHNLNSKIHVPHTPDDLYCNKKYQELFHSKHQIIDMTSRILQSFGHRDNECREDILTSNDKAYVFNMIEALHHMMPILPVPSGNDVPPLDESTEGEGNEDHDHGHDHDAGDEYNEEEYIRKLKEKEDVEIAAKELKRLQWENDVAHKDILGKLVNDTNTSRYGTLKVLLHTIVTFSVDEKSRSLLCDGYNDRTNILKVLLRVMSTAFHDRDSYDYRNYKLDEILHFTSFQNSNGWKDHHSEIYKEVRRNPHMATHKTKSKIGLIERMNQLTHGSGNDKSNSSKKIKGAIVRGPPKSPTRTNILNLHQTPRLPPLLGNSLYGTYTSAGSLTSTAGNSSQVLGSVNEKIKAPQCIIVAEHACWALTVLTVHSCEANRLELLECGKEELKSIAATVHGTHNDNEDEPLLLDSSVGSRPSSRQTNSNSNSNSKSNSPVPVPSKELIPITSPRSSARVSADIDKNISSNDSNSNSSNASLGTITENKLIGEEKKKSNIPTVAIPVLSVPVPTIKQEPSIISHDTLHALHRHEIPFYSRLFKLIKHVNAVHDETELNHLQAEEGHLPESVTMDDLPPMNIIKKEKKSNTFLT